MSANFTPNQNEYNNMTPFKTWLKYQINTWGLNSFPFVESDFDDLTNYAMMMKLMKHFNVLIENQNMVEEDMTNLYNAFTELQTYLFNEFADYKNEVDGEIEQFETSITNDFNTLHDYVENYFDNLDVQDEINNKLDDMVEQGTLQEIITSYLNTQALFVYDNVASMKSATNLIDGSYAKTLGFYALNDGGSATYKIRGIENDDVVDNATIIAMNNNQLIAELVKTFPVNAKQIGCKTDGTDNSTIINNYLSNHNTTGLYFPDGVYVVSSEIDTIGNVTMSNNAWLKAGTSMDCVVHINKNATIPSGSFANNSTKNLKFIINVDCDKKASTGIRTDKLQWAKLTLSVKNATQYGVYTRYNTSYGCAENTYDIQVLYDTEDGTNTSTGLYVGGTDDIYNSVISINTKYGVELHGGDNSFGTIHCWLVNSDLWSGSIMLRTSSVKNHIDNLIIDTYETGIGKTSNFNVSNFVFGLYIDFAYGLINTSFIPETLRSSYKIWDFTGLTGTAKNNSAFHIMNYVGNDANTAKISVADDGNCPFNSSFKYNDDYTSIKWIYSLNNCPEGSFLFTGDTDVTGKPTGVTGGTYVLTTKNTSTGKLQELMNSGYTRTQGNTTYNTDNCIPTANFIYYYKRILSKWNTGSSNWGAFASYYIADNYTPSE